MRLPRRKFLQLAAGVAGLPIASTIAGGQGFPTRLITMIVPFAAGGPGDAIWRILAEPMKTSLGQPLITENVPGAAGSIGAGRVARAVPDGCTLCFGSWPTHVANGAVLQLQYDVLNDFESIVLIADSPLIIVSKKSMPANDLGQLIGWLKANPDRASQTTLGIGSAGHIAGVYFQKETGTRFQFVPYRGGIGPAMQDLIAGHVDLSITNPAATLPLIRTGAIKAYAVTGKRRLAVAPEVATADEAGLRGFNFSVWIALFAPKGTPKDIVARLNAAAVAALADPIVHSRLTDLGQEIPPREQQTPDALGAYHKGEIEKWWPIIKAAGIRAQ